MKNGVKLPQQSVQIKLYKFEIAFNFAEQRGMKYFINIDNLGILIM